MVKTVGKYDIFHTLGEGSYAKVKFAVHRDTKQSYAIKILDKEKIHNQNMGAQLKKEIGIMKMVHHPYVVAVQDVFATGKKIFIVLELVEGGELFDKIASEGRLSEDRARFHFKQLVEGMEYCHSLGICHRDLKPENLLLDAKGDLKITDFGVSTLTIGDAESEGEARGELLRTTCGTPNYVAPEVLANKGYDGKKADVWSMGVILYVLLAGFLPFEEATMVALFKKIQNCDFTYPNWFTEEVILLLNKILVVDTSVRMTLQELKACTWLNVVSAAVSTSPVTSPSAPSAPSAPPSAPPVLTSSPPADVANSPTPKSRNAEAATYDYDDAITKGSHSYSDDEGGKSTPIKAAAAKVSPKGDKDKVDLSKGKERKVKEKHSSRNSTPTSSKPSTPSAKSTGSTGTSTPTAVPSPEATPSAPAPVVEVPAPIKVEASTAPPATEADVVAAATDMSMPDKDTSVVNVAATANPLGCPCDLWSLIFPSTTPQVSTTHP